ncbi:lipid II:glycine glycyltransferase FemX [Natronobeatus ordinarius]|uniref:lipid II:glycine glycyltransferase FemX n=1 Tax=Natronobeatus ordinarius TaxID=2963433 RepID=UPI0020CF9F31|nr:GNAT family N-acetyltransferase [Natronobeatus ordinarius]
MSFRITTLEADDRETWNTYVERSPHGTLFHRYDSLEVQADHAGSTLHPLVGYKGEEPVGVLPIFAQRKGPVTLAFSPPYELGVPTLGPALLHMDQLKQRKREKRHRRFVEGCLEWIDDRLEPRYTSIQAGWRYDDVRPFVWNGFEATPSYTYVIDLERGREALLSRFSQSARRHVRNNEDGYDVEVGGEQEVHWILARLRERYAEQGRNVPVSSAFVSALYGRLADEGVRPYVLRVDGEPVTGTILLEWNETARSWLGGAKPDVGLPANDLLEWQMMCDALDRGQSTFEIVGANTPRLNEWKTKFSPEIRSYYQLERTTPGMEAAKQLYTTLRDRSTLVSRLGPASEP